MTRAVWRGALLLAAGCASYESPGEYALARAEAECDRLQVCELGFWESEYTSEEDCASEREDRLSDRHEELEDLDCDFDPEQATFCVERVRAMSCEDWGYSNQGDKACDLVWTCLEAR